MNFHEAIRRNKNKQPIGPPQEIDDWKMIRLPLSDANFVTKKTAR